MPLTEQDLGLRNQENKTSEPNVRVVHDIPLADLLKPEDRVNPIAEDHVSIYSVERSQGTEYDVVFEPQDGQKLYDRQVQISKRAPGIYDVMGDIGTIVH